MQAVINLLEDPARDLGLLFGEGLGQLGEPGLGLLIDRAAAALMCLSAMRTARASA
jgi:hypothetical protein